MEKPRGSAPPAAPCVGHGPGRRAAVEIQIFGLALGCSVEPQTFLNCDLDMLGSDFFPGNHES